MIPAELVDKAGYQAMKTAVTVIPADVHQAIQEAYRAEESPDARRLYRILFQHIDRQSQAGELICPDTGTLMYYVAIGSNARLDPQVDFWKAFSQATVHLTKEGFLPPKAGDPVRGTNNYLNTGENSPAIQYKYVPGIDYVEVTAVAKGGCGELAGSKFKMLTPSDGLVGIKRFILDSALAGAMGGANSAPTIFGIGIGGGLAVAATMAHEAAVLRPVGSRHPDRFIAEMEEELLELINSSGIGPAGLGGQRTALDVHIDYSYGHVAVVAVAITTLCVIVHRATVKIHPDGSLEEAPHPHAWLRGASRS